MGDGCEVMVKFDPLICFGRGRRCFNTWTDQCCIAGHHEQQGQRPEETEVHSSAEAAKRGTTYTESLKIYIRLPADCTVNCKR